MLYCAKALILTKGYEVHDHDAAQVALGYLCVPDEIEKEDLEILNQSFKIFEDEYVHYFEDAKREVDLESKEQDLIRTNLGYVSFVSKSKGRGRRRRNWKEVELFRFAGGDMRMGLHYRWHTANKARFHEMTEIMNKEMADSPISGDDLMWYAKAHCDRNGGKQHGIH